MASPQIGISVAGKVFFGTLCVGTFGLGVWQTRRLFEKQDMVKSREADLAMEPTSHIPKDFKSTFRRIQLQGTFQHNKELLVGPRGPPPGALPDKPGSSAQGMSSSPQGYFVLTPFVVDDNSIVLINRGWVPRHLAASDHRRPRQQQQQSHPEFLKWDRPQDKAQVTVVPAKGEQPKYLVAQHELDQKPPKLYWFDLNTMQKLVYGNLKEEGKDLPFLTQVSEEEKGHDSISWPVQPTADKVGEFKVSPAVHAGYAFTWYGLSAAGLYMTRKLLTRGRS